MTWKPAFDIILVRHTPGRRQRYEIDTSLFVYSFNNIRSNNFFSFLPCVFKFFYLFVRRKKKINKFNATYIADSYRCVCVCVCWDAKSLVCPEMVVENVYTCTYFALWSAFWLSRFQKDFFFFFILYLFDF